MIRTAKLSKDQKQRYTLSRIWDKSKNLCMFIMLNPSTADSNEDDATIRRCISFAKTWGYGGFWVGNVYTYRSPNPKDILKEKPLRKGNLKALKFMSKKVDKIICAWGSNIKNNKTIVNTLLNKVGITNLFHLGLNKDGTPKHPLYLKKDTVPKDYEI